MKNLVIALDFDGTIKLPVTYGVPVSKTYLSYGFDEFYKWCTEHGVILVLWTCRNLSVPMEMSYVQTFLTKNNLYKIYIPFRESGSDLICKNLRGEEVSIFSSGARKIIADIYIDDRGAGCPVMSNCPEQIDWNKMLLKVKMHLLGENQNGKC